MAHQRIFPIFLMIFLMVCAGRAQQDSAAMARQAAEQAEILRSENQLSAKMDKMLDSWYVKHANANARSVLSHLSDTNTVSDANCDSIYKLRLSRIASVVQLGYDPAVRSYINLYANIRKKSSSAILGLAQYYYPRMTAIFDKYDVPEELVYLTIIESALNPTAVSPAGATGIWQFMYQTGKTYGLEVNTFVDDRRDPMKATDAAARHLRDLYNIFNDWGLAISAYNCGAGNVRKAINRSGGKTTFWEVRPFLPRETQNYFPAYIGAYYMMKYYKMHGITPADIRIPLDVDTIMIHKEVHLEQISQVLGIPLEEIQTLNPQYKRNVIPAFTEPFPLRLRRHDLERFEAMQDSIYKYQYDTYFAPLQMYVNTYTGKSDGGATSKKKYHTVRSGESLTKIANKYGISVAELKRMNHIKSNYIKVGQKLVVGYTYVAPQKPAETDKPAADSTATQAGTPTPATTKPAETKPTTPAASSSSNDIIYTVKKGDSLYQIATRYGLTVKRLAEYNHITNINSLHVGQKLKIPKK
ncbi:MAG: LysM peptidoglycan-binding domain-containing protein [Bacteroidales bacterium]|nr:LysM peptidoglycan-binding domain-containing protein [Bacteroidales bacterium]